MQLLTSCSVGSTWTLALRAGHALHTPSLARTDFVCTFYVVLSCWPLLPCELDLHSNKRLTRSEPS